MAFSKDAGFLRVSGRFGFPALAATLLEPSLPSLLLTFPAGRPCGGSGLPEGSIGGRAPRLGVNKGVSKSRL